MVNDMCYMNLAAKIRSTDISSQKVVMGFDGFVDNVVYVVDKRLDADNYERVQYLKDYGEKIVRAAGKSMNVEMVPIQKKLGGNGPILANSLLSLGGNMTYIGALGKGGINPVFAGLKRCEELYSVSDPGNTDAIEFLDGKIISSQLEPLKDVNWENICREVGLEKLIQLFEEADLIGFENWTLLINMTDLWKHFLKEVIPCMEPVNKNQILFVDLADPEKRKDEDILEAFELLKEFTNYFKLVLGLNYKEAVEVAQLYGAEGADTWKAPKLAEYIRKFVPVAQLVVHPVEGACAASDSGTYWVDGPYCEKPVLTTGAGDNFNAGYVLGLLLGCNEEESLLLGTANSGFYVRNARSASAEELAEFLIKWGQGNI